MQPSPLPSTRWKDSPNFEKQPKKGKPALTPSPLPVSPNYTVAQARLDSISSPSDHWYWGRCEGARRWLRLSQAEKQSTAARLSADCSTLKTVLSQPPESMTGKEWLMLHHRLRRWQGLLSALEE